MWVLIIWILLDVEIISGGSNYSSAPNLLVFNPVSNTVGDDASLQAIVPNQTISNVEVIAPINGLDSINHRIVATNNSNGVGINSVILAPYPNAGIVITVGTYKWVCKRTFCNW